MKAAIFLVLATSVVFTSCTGYKKIVEVSKNENLTYSDIADIEVGDKLAILQKKGKARSGKLLYLDSTSMSIKLPSKETFHSNLSDVRRIKYDPSSLKTAGNFATVTIGIGGLIAMIALVSFLASGGL